MILNLAILQENVTSFNQQARGKRGQVQKIFASAGLLCLGLRYPGYSVFLYLGRGNGIEGIWAGSKVLPSHLRQIDKFLEYVRSKLQGAMLLNMACDLNDRCLQIDFTKNNGSKKLLYFWQARKSYFALVLETEVNTTAFLSWENRQVELATSKEYYFEVFDSVGRKKLELRENITIVSPGEGQDGDIQKIINFEVGGTERPNTKKRKFLARKRDNIVRDLAKLRSWPRLMNWALNIKEDVEGREVQEIEGVLFKFTPGTNHHQRLNIIFEKAKSFKSAEKLLEERLEEVEKELEQSLVKMTVAKTLPRYYGPIWPTDKAAGKISKQWELDIRPFCFVSGERLLIGKNAQDNDRLRNRWAQKDDYWFHLESYPGAHGFLRLAPGMVLQDLSIQITASALRDANKLSITTISIIFTRVKYLRSVKKHPGLVRYTNEKHLSVDYLSNWRENLS